MLIEFQSVSFRRDGRPVLSDLTFRLSERRIGIVGPNGSGKSSLARMINGLLSPTSGVVRVNGLDTQTHVKAVRRQVGFVFQHPENQIVLPQVLEDIEFGLKKRLPDVEARKHAAMQALSDLGIPELASRSAYSLSGGEKQLVALAAVLATQPALLVLDEPTTQLDLKNRNRLVHTLAALEQPLIMVSHDLELMKTMDRVLVLDDGRLLRDDEPAAALDWYRSHCG